MSSDGLERLQRWYRSNCDGTWEHGYGIHLDTLDNPGWMLKVQLVGTPLADVAFTKVELHRSEDDWLVCRVEERTFQAYGGPENLAEMIDTFLRWAEARPRARALISESSEGGEGIQLPASRAKLP